MSKYCPTCEEVKNESAFYSNRSRPDGLTWECGSCALDRRNTQYRSNPEKERKAVKKWQAKNPEKVKENNRLQGIKRYGLNDKSYSKILETQNYKCAICRLSIEKREQQHVDHDHKCCVRPARSCGKCVRGILCNSCNAALGHFKENIQIFEAAIIYLRRYGAHAQTN